MIVRESLNFERGIDPKKSMDIGKSKLDKELIENTEWAIDDTAIKHIYEIIEVIRDYRGYPILVMRNKQHEEWPYRATSIIGVFGEYAPTPEDALKGLKKIINRIEQSPGESRYPGYIENARTPSVFTYESQNFERGIDPKKSMRIGEIDLINRIDWDVNIHHVNFTEPTEIIKFIRDYKGFPIVIVKWHGEFEGRMRDNYFGVSSTSGMGRSGFTDSPLRAERNVKRLLDNRIKRSYNK